MRGLNLDGLVGSTHHYGGVAHGNLASKKNQASVSNPRAAALEGLAKMRVLLSLKIPQGILPPQPRPRWDVLAALGFSGDRAKMLQAAHEAQLLSRLYSASSMWAANAATISASRDTLDSRVHLTPASMSHALHRSLEAAQTHRVLSQIFAAPNFVVHPPLPASAELGDEGAANHMRLAPESGDEGALNIFVYGVRAQGSRFVPRQSRAASEAIARRHQLKRACFLEQSPRAIDAGAFHNDVVALAQGAQLLAHEEAFADPAWQEKLRAEFPALRAWVVRSRELSLEEAVATYLFNSQLVLCDEGLVLIAPIECQESPRARAVIDRLQEEGLSRVVFVDVRQSMRNGGGPACLRLHLPLSEEELRAVHPGVLCTAPLLDKLEAWIERYYRESLSLDDLPDPQLADEAEQAIDALSEILDLSLA